jgi:protein gp37
MTKIEWTDKTWNPIVGCSKISAGCVNCYAAEAAKSPRLQQFPQYAHVGGWDGKVQFVDSQLRLPFTWRKSKRIFVCSMSDLFHENISDFWRNKIFAVIAICKQHNFQILTKRPENMRRYFASNPWQGIANEIERIGDNPCTGHLVDEILEMSDVDYLENCWLGVTVENQDMADKRIPILLQTPAKIHWLSVEPLLEEVDLGFCGTRYSCPTIRGYIDWVVVGGESGGSRRQCEVKWIEKIVKQCDNAVIDVFVKQDSHRFSGQQGRLSDEYWARKEFPVIY